MDANNSNNKRIERKPNLEFTSKLSADGRYWIFKRTETWVLPRNYLETIAANFKPEVSHAKDQTKASNHEDKTNLKGKRNANSNGKGN